MNFKVEGWKATVLMNVFVFFFALGVWKFFELLTIH